MTSNLSTAQVQELKDAFDMFDQGKTQTKTNIRTVSMKIFALDRSGVISRDEMRNVFNALNIKVTQDQVDQCVSRMDTNNSSKITVNF